MRARTTAAAAGLTYALGAAVENQEVLDAPTLGSSAAEIQAHFADQTLAAVAWIAGAVSLIAYAVFVVLLRRLLLDRGDPGPSVTVGLVAGLVAALLAMGALVASAGLAFDLAGAGGDLADTFEVSASLRLWAGAALAVFLAAYGVGALRTGAWPAGLARGGIAIGVLCLAGPIAALTESGAFELLAGLAFAAQAAWVAALSLWLAFGGQPLGDFVRRSAFLVLALAAGGIGLALLAAPGATSTFFSWGLRPEALAAFAGGVYAGSASLYALAIPEDSRATRGLVAGAVTLSVSVLAATLIHLDQFDLDRGQAWAWLILFTAFSAVSLWLLVAGSDRGGGDELLTRDRSLLWVAAAALGAIAVVLWAAPADLAASPYELPELGGRFAGSWAAMLAAIAGWAAATGDRAQGRLAGLALALVPAGVAIGGLRTLGQLEYPEAILYFGGLIVLVSLGVSIARSAGNPRA